MTTSQNPGRFAWRDLLTPDPDRAMRFYSELFGWQVVPFEMEGGRVYDMFRNGSDDFGGVMPSSPGNGERACWLSYITTTNLERTCGRATDLGATIVEAPVTVPGVGSFAIIADAQGALFAPFQPDYPMNADQAVIPGGIDWNELATTDPEAASAFYARLFGWEIGKFQVDGDYMVVRSDGMLVGGIFPGMAQLREPGWTIYFRVLDIGKAVGEVERLGGAVTFRPREIPGVGWTAGVTDPTGAHFALMQPAATWLPDR